MGISLSQYRAAIGLWRRPSAVSTNLDALNSFESIQRGKINNAIGLINIFCLVSTITLLFAAPELGLSASLMTRQCLKTLLVMSGVEQNPGPASQQNAIEELQ